LSDLIRARVAMNLSAREEFQFDRYYRTYVL